jgi:hypothetical protein
MSKKFSAARKRAFLHYLAETGNQTISAERAKVSRSWVCLHRKEDAEFDAACRVAIAAAKASLDPLGTNGRNETPPPLTPPACGRGISSNQPPRGWNFLDGVELVVRGSNGRRVQIGRARIGQWSARVEDRFLAALSATCNVKAACAEVGKHATSAYAHRRRWTAFARRWDEAIETGYVRIEMALLAAGCNLFSGSELPPEEALRDMTVDQAIHILHMHKHEARGIGGRPGLRARIRPFADVSEGIQKKIDIIVRARALGS